ncbi:hypothetical protein HOF92_12720 [bacterium]|nr:hypothetical protein [bacterium]
MNSECRWLSFRLPDDFVDSYRDQTPPFGFDGLGELVFYRTYSRLKKDGSKESFLDVVRRCVEGAYSLQKDHILVHHLGWNEEKAIQSAKLMFDHIFHMRFLPAGRGLWMMGTEYAHTKTPMGLFNCAFVCTEDIEESLEESFTFLMDVSMLGVGCGFSTKGAGKLSVRKPVGIEKRWVVEDSREGWVESTGALIRSYIHPVENPIYEFDYSKLRGAGTLIQGFGGVAAGPEPLLRLHEQIRDLFDERLLDGRATLDSRLITDIMNLMGECVVAGNIRRTAELALGEPEDEEFLDLKNYELNPERKNFGRFSNNSVFASVGMDYQPLAERSISNGEPGYIWLDTIQKYGRMIDPPNYKDSNAKGCNPCVEQSLESYEVCNLVEIFPSNIKDKSEFLEVVKCAYLYGKSVTLVKTHKEVTNRVQLRNRRIGLSLSGLALFRESRGTHTMVEWMDQGYEKVQYYDGVYSKWLAIPHSIKTTSVKPSGTISLVAGTTAGIHYPEGQYYFKNLRLSTHSPLVRWARESGYKIEPEIRYVQDEDGKWVSQPGDETVVVSLPVHFDTEIRSRGEVSIWEQMKLVELAQKYWADNQVSCTVTFREHEEKEVVRVLEMFDRDVKNACFFRYCSGDYPQMPEEPITKDEYDSYVQTLRPQALKHYLNEEAIGEQGCSNDTCMV